MASFKSMMTSNNCVNNCAKSKAQSNGITSEWSDMIKCRIVVHSTGHTRSFSHVIDMPTKRCHSEMSMIVGTSRVTTADMNRINEKIHL
jgi:hypothetical protein